MPIDAAPTTGDVAAQASIVRHLRQVLLWPVRLMQPPPAAGVTQRPWEVLRALEQTSPWREMQEEYTGRPDSFHERHYNEFVSFLPYVQRFLYGERRAGIPAARGAPEDGDLPMRVFRRRDIAAMRVTMRPGEAPITLQVMHVDLYFFFDIDVVLLTVELSGDDLTLAQVQELLYRCGRAYPSGWDADGLPLHSPVGFEWLDCDGRVLAQSDAKERDAFLEHVARHRAPRIAAHWAWLMQPLVSDGSEEGGALRYRQIEYYRMPLMAYLALDEPKRLTRGDFVRLGLVTGAGGGQDEPNPLPLRDGDLPYAEHHLADFEQRYCYDRFWIDSGAAPRTRYLCSGHALIVVGDARSAFFGCGERGVLAQFRHQHFLLFLIAHLQKAALLMFSDQLVEALRRLDIRNTSSVKQFKRAIRGGFERFLRFTHRYWFHEISEQAQVRALSHLCAGHLGLDSLYKELRERFADMNTYLEADSLRRQASTVVRLTVVTLFGLIGSISTGFLGMNLWAEAYQPLWWRVLLFCVVLVACTWLTFYTMVKSQRLSDFVDAVSNDRMTLRGKLAALARVWRPGSD